MSQKYRSKILKYGGRHNRKYNQNESLEILKYEVVYAIKSTKFKKSAV